MRWGLTFDHSGWWLCTLHFSETAVMKSCSKKEKKKNNVSLSFFFFFFEFGFDKFSIIVWLLFRDESVASFLRCSRQ
jgi:hypothetical protein